MIVTKLLELNLSQSNISNLVNSLEYLDKLQRCRGTDGIKAWKSASDFMTRWIVTGVRPNVEGRPRIKHRNNVPLKFSVYIRLARKGYEHKILAITILNWHRLFDAKDTDYSVSTITKPSRFSLHTFQDMYWDKSFLEGGFWSKIRNLEDTIKSWDMNWRFANKSGPNGSIGIYNIRKDFHSIRKSEFYFPLIGLLRSLLRRCEDLEKAEEVEQLLNFLVKEVKVSGNSIRAHLKNRGFPLWDSKLSFLREKSGKTRVVAIGDAWSQFVLRPIHDHIFHILKKVFKRVDGTFDQDYQKKRVSRWASYNRMLFCFDLSAATDRLPLAFQRLVLTECKFLDIREVSFWNEIMSSRDFHYTVPSYTFKVPGDASSRWAIKVGDIQYSPSYLPRKNGKGYTRVRVLKVKKCRYAVGQPMGLLSSFGMLALTHHVIVQLAAYKAGYSCKGDKLYTIDYALLGDDIVIADEKVADHYMMIMKELDVTVNLSKSYCGRGLGEFAKALFSEGRDISPIPTKPISLRPETYFPDVMSINENLRKRGLSDSLLNFVSAVTVPIRKKTKKENSLDLQKRALKRKYLIMNLSSPLYQYRYNGYELWPKDLVDTWKEVIEINRFTRLAKTVSGGDFQLDPGKFDPFPFSGWSWVTPQEQYVREVDTTRAFAMDKDFVIVLGEDFIMWDPMSWGTMSPRTVLNSWVREVILSRDSEIKEKKKFTSLLNRMNSLRLIFGLPDNVVSQFVFGLLR